jgi:hypothetical protein
MIQHPSYREFISSNVNVPCTFWTFNGTVPVHSDRVLNSGPDLCEFELLDPELFENE